MNATFEPSYLSLLKNGELKEKVSAAVKHLTTCNLCPHECGVNRQEKLGFCRSTDTAIIASYGPHFGEESPLVGRHGSGTIFFGYCNMRCVFCQNCEISFGGEGEAVSNRELAEIMLKLQNRYNCHNINFVTPTHFVPNILDALLTAAEGGLKLPLVYNCGGYERISTLEILDGVIDIYMPDFKYSLPGRGEKYSGVKLYPEIVQAALKEMDRQVGGLKTDNDGIAYRGLIIRHLMMPGGLEDTKEILKFIKEELSPDCLVNLMKQYYPAHQAFQFKELSKRLGSAEYKQALDFAKRINLTIRGN